MFVSQPHGQHSADVILLERLGPVGEGRTLSGGAISGRFGVVWLSVTKVSLKPASEPKILAPAVS